jgi:hypothetical protein
MPVAPGTQQVPATGKAATRRDGSAGNSIDSPGTVLFASLIGNATGFFDFCIHAPAAVLVFPKRFSRAVKYA